MNEIFVILNCIYTLACLKVKCNTFILVHVRFNMLFINKNEKLLMNRMKTSDSSTNTKDLMILWKYASRKARSIRQIRFLLDKIVLKHTNFELESMKFNNHDNLMQRILSRGICIQKTLFSIEILHHLHTLFWSTYQKLRICKK